jgi:hypothetical protein
MMAPILRNMRKRRNLRRRIILSYLRGSSGGFTLMLMIPWGKLQKMEAEGVVDEDTDGIGRT